MTTDQKKDKELDNLMDSVPLLLEEHKKPKIKTTKIKETEIIDMDKQQYKKTVSAHKAEIAKEKLAIKKHKILIKQAKLVYQMSKLKGEK